MSAWDTDPYDDPVCDACGREADERVPTTHGRIWLCWGCLGARIQALYESACAEATQ